MRTSDDSLVYFGDADGTQVARCRCGDDELVAVLVTASGWPGRIGPETAVTLAESDPGNSPNLLHAIDVSEVTCSIFLGRS